MYSFIDITCTFYNTFFNCVESLQLTLILFGLIKLNATTSHNLKYTF